MLREYQINFPIDQVDPQVLILLPLLAFLKVDLIAEVSDLNNHSLFSITHFNFCLSDFNNSPLGNLVFFSIFFGRVLWIFLGVVSEQKSEIIGLLVKLDSLYSLLES